jgi:biopolymer transport protein ExbB
MPRYLILLLVLTTTALGAFPWTSTNAQADDARKTREAELVRVKNELETARAALQNEITRRYTLKQRGVEQREADKEEMERLRERQERIFTDLSRLKEECLARQQTLDDEHKATAIRIDEWKSVRESIGDLLLKEPALTAEAFPLDRETRRSDAETITQELRRNNDPAIVWVDFVSYRMKFIAAGDTVSLVKQTLVTDDGDAQTLTVARLGSVSGYGINAQGALYVLRQTGALGTAKYAIDKVGSPELTAFLQQAFPTWLSTSRVDGPVLTDVMQNDFTKTLITGKKASRWASLAKWFKNGGPVMYPLVLVTLWALLLWLLKVLDFGNEHRYSVRVNRKITALLAEGKHDDVYTSLAGSKGISARIARFCFDNKDKPRETSERMIKEILIGESVRLGRHINTLAVLATASPLLGLLGTVTGMINLFAVLTQYGNSDPKLVAGGISEALVTTQTGMMIAIPIVLIHNHLRNRKNRIQAELEKNAISLLNRLWP